MRKTMIVLGLLMFCGAIAAIGYRWVLQPQRMARAPAKVEQMERAPATRSLQQLPAGAPRPTDDVRAARPAVKAKDTTQPPQGWQMFEMAIDVLNVVVGLAGIWLALMGMKMQREAAMALKQKSDA